MKIGMKRLSLILCILTVNLLPAVPARAATVKKYLTSNYDFNLCPGSACTLPIPGLSHTFNLDQGKSRYLLASARITGDPPTWNQGQIGVAIRLDCNGGAGVINSQNWRGSGAESNGILLRARWLFTAPDPGTSSYTCDLRVNADTDYTPPTQMRAVGAAGTSSETWLGLTDSDESGVPEGWTDGRVDPYFSVGESDYVLRNNFISTAASSSVVVVSDVQLYTCQLGSTSCAQVTNPAASTSEVDTRLRVAQLQPRVSGGPAIECSAALGWYPSTGYLRSSVSKLTHHFKILHSLTFTKSNAADCGDEIAIKTYFKLVSGNIVRVEKLGGYNPLSLWSNGVALNR